MPITTSSLEIQAQSGGDVWLAGSGQSRNFSQQRCQRYFRSLGRIYANLYVWIHSSSIRHTEIIGFAAGSPCINAGANNAPSLPATDFDDNARIGYGHSQISVLCGSTSASICASLQPTSANGVLLQWPSVAGVKLHRPKIDRFIKRIFGCDIILTRHTAREHIYRRSCT